MNTIKIRQRNPELIKRLRESIRSYKEWTSKYYEGDKGVAGVCYNATIFKKYPDSMKFYSSFLLRSIADDIQELKEKTYEFEENNNSSRKPYCKY